LAGGSLCFGGEKSAGAFFSRRGGTVWTTDKDGFIPALLSAEITAKTGGDPGPLFNKLTQESREPFCDCIEPKTTPDEKEKLEKLSASQIKHKYLSGEKIKNILTNPGNDALIGGVKALTENRCFAACPSGKEDIYKIYAESFLGKDHFKKIIDETQTIVNATL